MIAAFFYGYSFEFSAQSAGTFLWGPAFWPRLFAGVICFAAVMQFYEALRGTPAKGLMPEHEDEAGPTNWVRVAGIFAVPLIYVFALPRIGFFVATPIFLVAELVMLGERNPRRIAGVTFGVFLAICLVFTTLFYVGLPVGNWPGFYEVNILFVQFLRIG
jgi:hypothetical protein